MNVDGEAVPAYPHLLAAFQLGNRRLKNRVVHAAMSTRFQSGGQVTDRLIAYHANRARGGASLSVTEPLATLTRQIGTGRVDVINNSNAAGLRRWAEAVSYEGAGLIAQIQDPGRGSHEEGRPGAPIGASALPDDLSWMVAHALSICGRPFGCKRHLEGLAISRMLPSVRPVTQR